MRDKMKSRFAELKRESYIEWVEKKAREIKELPPQKAGKEIWNFVGCVQKQGAKAGDAKAPLDGPDNELCHTAEEKVKAFTVFNTEKYSEPDKAKHDAEAERLLSRNANAKYREDMRISRSTHSILGHTVSHAEIVRAIVRLKRRRALHSDEIPPEALQLNPVFWANVFLLDIEVCPSWDYVQEHRNLEDAWIWTPGMDDAAQATAVIGCPLHWQEGTLIFLFKGGGKDPRKWKSYRPVSLLSTFYKLWATIQNERLRLVLEDTSSRWQFGYKERVGCSEALQAFDMIVRNCTEPELCVSLLDMSE